MKSIKLKVELCGVKSVRHVVVPENITLVTLHEVIQGPSAIAVKTSDADSDFPRRKIHDLELEVLEVA